LTAWLLERDEPNTLIGTFPDALCWAIERTSTVGYGDIHPVTTGGRVVAWFSTELVLLREFAEIEEVSEIERATLTQVLAELQAIRARSDHLDR
jgi:Ion channel